MILVLLPCSLHYLELTMDYSDTLLFALALLLMVVSYSFIRSKRQCGGREIKNPEVGTTFGFESIPFGEKPVTGTFFSGDKQQPSFIYEKVGQLNLTFGQKTEINAVVHRESQMTYSCNLGEFDYFVCVGEPAARHWKLVTQVELWNGERRVFVEKLSDVSAHGPVITGFRRDGSFVCLVHGSSLNSSLFATW